MTKINVSLSKNEIRAIKTLAAYRLTYLMGLGEPSGTPTALQIKNLQMVLLTLGQAEGLRLRAGAGSQDQE